MAMSLRDRPVREKLIIVSMLATLAALFLVSVAYITNDILSIRQSMVNKYISIADITAENITPALIFGDEAAASSTLQTLGAEPYIASASIFDRNGRLFSSFDPLKGHEDKHGHIEQHYAEFKQAKGCGTYNFSMHHIYMCRAIRTEDGVLGELFLAAEIDELIIALRDDIIISLIVLALSILLAYLLSSRLSQLITEPVGHLAHAMSQVSNSKDYATRVPKESRDEIGLLADGFNDMLAQIEAWEERVKHYQQDLEEEVSRRTQQLSETVDKLEKARQEAEEASNAKSDFLSRMSHELRTPLNAILGFAQLLQMDARTEEQKNDSEQILKAGSHLLELINEVLDLSKIESGCLELTPENVGLNQTLQECFTLIRPLADKNNIRIIDKITTDSNHFLITDHVRFKQVMLNLLSNAVKYNSIGGKILLQQEIADSGRLRILVTDTGQGLSSEQQQQLFKPFERVNQENSHIEGTGIGLVITKHLMELMGGEIGCDCPPGIGCTFWVECPLSTATETTSAIDTKTAIEPGAPKNNSNREKTILYIEDNPANLELVNKMVSRYTPHALLCAPDASLGLELARSHRPDLILMDINLPGMNGFEALAQLRATQEIRQTPVIAVSANAMKRDIEKGMAAGFHDYLTKPLSTDKLLKTLETVFN